MIESAYIHIPFCTNICSYCDFPKLYYHKHWIRDYLKSLEYEIKKYYNGETLKTLYIGGGTPTSLEVDELKYLLEIMKMFKQDNDIEYTVECNLENLTKEKLDLMKQYGVNRLSIGVQSFQKRNLEFLKRTTSDTSIIKYAKEIGFNNINIDLIYAIPGETMEDIENDLKEIIKLDISHVSTYSLIIEEGTLLFLKKVKSIDSLLDSNMYNRIIKVLKENGYLHYEISNFCKPGYESKHNLTYWNNAKYYGFGMGASGYIKNIRYTNTKSINNYLKHQYHYEEEILSLNDCMSYEMILGLRKIEGVSINKFIEKYKKSIEETYEIESLLEKGYLIKENEYLKIPEQYLYISNDILIHFV